MSNIEMTTIERIANYLSINPSARNVDIISYVQGSFGVNFGLSRWMYIIDCARGNI